MRGQWQKCYGNAFMKYSFILFIYGRCSNGETFYEKDREMIEVTDVEFCSHQLSKTFVALWYVTIIIVFQSVYCMCIL